MELIVVPSSSIEFSSCIVRFLSRIWTIAVLEMKKIQYNFYFLDGFAVFVKINSMLKIKFFYYLLLVFIFVATANAKTHFFIINGSEDDGSTHNIFAAELSKMIGPLKKLDLGKMYVVMSLKQVDLVNEVSQFTPNITAFNQENILSKISELESDLERTDDLKVFNPNDKLIIIISAHGVKNTSDAVNSQVEISHSILTHNQQGEKSFTSLDKLVKSVELAQRKQLKVALIDLSCHSGFSQKLMTLFPQGLCLISSSSSHLVSYQNAENSFAGLFLKKIKRGVPLKDIFYQARAGSVFPDLPQINDNHFMHINSQFNELLQPYFMFNVSNKFFGSDDQLVKLILELSQNQVAYKEFLLNYERLKTQLSKFSSLEMNMSISIDNEINYAQQLLSSVEKIHNRYLSFISRAKEMKFYLLNHNSIVKEDYIASVRPLTYASLNYQMYNRDLITSDLNHELIRSLQQRDFINDQMKSSALKKIYQKFQSIKNTLITDLESDAILKFQDFILSIHQDKIIKEHIYRAAEAEKWMLYSLIKNQPESLNASACESVSAD